MNLRIFIFLLLFLSYQKCFSVSPLQRKDLEDKTKASYQELSAKKKAEYFEKGIINIDQFGGADGPLSWAYFGPSPYKNQYTDDYNDLFIKTPFNFDYTFKIDDFSDEKLIGTPEYETKREELRKAQEILKRGPKNKLEQYKASMTIPSYIDYIIPSLPLSLSPNSSQKIIIDDFSFEIVKNKSYGNNIFINTSRGKLGLETNKTPDCIIETYRVDDSTISSIDHHTLSYKPQQKEEGKLVYTLAKSCDILREFSQPILQLKFSAILAPFNINFSLIDDQGFSQSYPKIDCSSENLIYSINLLNPYSSNIDLTRLKNFSFTFQANGIETNPLFHLDSIEIVPEPLSMLTLLTGFVSSIKINKFKNIIKR